MDERAWMFEVVVERIVVQTVKMTVEAHTFEEASQKALANVAEDGSCTAWRDGHAAEPIAGSVQRLGRCTEQMPLFGGQSDR